LVITANGSQRLKESGDFMLAGRVPQPAPAPVLRQSASFSLKFFFWTTERKRYKKKAETKGL
jgi:hypothetical protein